jgi:hypothetical protein
MSAYTLIKIKHLFQKEKTSKRFNESSKSSVEEYKEASNSNRAIFSFKKEGDWDRVDANIQVANLSKIQGRGFVLLLRCVAQSYGTIIPEKRSSGSLMPLLNQASTPPLFLGQKRWLDLHLGSWTNHQITSVLWFVYQFACDKNCCCLEI